MGFQVANNLIILEVTTVASTGLVTLAKPAGTLDIVRLHTGTKCILTKSNSTDPIYVSVVAIPGTSTVMLTRYNQPSGLNNGRLIVDSAYDAGYLEILPQVTGVPFQDEQQYVQF